ncbi:MAG: hypothetical protein QW227_02690 [Candidatus Aenigmatarchaeota archaeon]|nr:hypothetical protein [Candidatus Aenigmarchaeota archaeon]
MIDWFASRTGLLIFVVGALTILLAFYTMETGFLAYSTKVVTANDIARLVDAVERNVSVSYTMASTFNVSVSKHSLKLNDIERWFVATANPVELTDASSLLIENKDGVIYVTAQ